MFLYSMFWNAFLVVQQMMFLQHIQNTGSAYDTFLNYIYFLLLCLLHCYACNGGSKWVVDHVSIDPRYLCCLDLATIFPHSALKSARRERSSFKRINYRALVDFSRDVSYSSYWPQTVKFDTWRLYCRIPICRYDNAILGRRIISI